jgi:hypothetical protein
MKRIEIYIVGFSLPKLVTTCYQKDLANTLERLDLLGKCVMLRTVGALHDGDVLEVIERRPTLDELKNRCFVKVRGWDEMLKDGKLEAGGEISFSDFWYCFIEEMRKFCGTTHKMIKLGLLEGCEDYVFTPDMLTYVAPEAIK